MRDIELYGAILGIPAPWTVVSVGLDVTGQPVVVRVDAGPGPFACPECGAVAARYDSKPRRWRHLDTGQFTTSERLLRAWWDYQRLRSMSGTASLAK